MKLTELAAMLLESFAVHSRERVKGADIYSQDAMMDLHGQVEGYRRLIERAGWTPLARGFERVPLDTKHTTYCDRTVEVLVTDGKQIAYAYMDKDAEYGDTWHHVGRDAYTLEWVPTHWMPMPELPR